LRPYPPFLNVDQEYVMSMSFIDLLAGAVSLGLCIYLFFALVKPEKF
jgi:K+-transporting ATPase KdpF subunit